MTPSVLIVDDSLTVRMDLVQAFEADGFRASACATVAAAREALLRDKPDLAILDVILPDGNGVELLAEMRKVPELHELPVLLLSTHADVSDRIRGLDVGADDYVGKPYEIGYVLARARALLRQRKVLSGEEPPSVLVIDDSVSFRAELERALEGKGYRVISASTGEEGLRLALSVEPSLIVVDSVMPGIDGATVIRRVRLEASLRDVPCVLLTASDEQGAEVRALEAGADDFVRKEDLEVILARISAVRRSAGTERATGVLGPKRVLAVDDSPAFLRELSEVLSGEGYDVVLARSGEDAIALLAAQPVDCILLDLMMPGLDGNQTCRRIKGSSVASDIPLIILTDVDERSAMIESLSIGADDFIAKSGDFEVLKARVRAQLRRKQIEDEHRRARERLLRIELEAAEARAARELAETRARLVRELEHKNQELEAFSYSVSHDLRAPLRSIDGFSLAIVEEFGQTLDPIALGYLNRVRSSVRRMTELIDDLLSLSRIGRAELKRTSVDLSRLAAAVAEELQRREPDRTVHFAVEEGLTANADSRLLRVLLENLIGNAWKFTSKRPSAEVSVGCRSVDGQTTYYVRDNGAGFNMEYASKLFRPFQRLHSESQFSGTGIGLATVQRIVERHGGRIWVAAAVDAGATFFFTLETPEPASPKLTR